MTCYSPLQAYRPPGDSDSKKLVWNLRRGEEGESVQVPCNQCLGCRLEYSRQWAIRCMHEASLYVDNCFITLTFSDKYLPKDRSLDLSIFQKFLKRLRKKFYPHKIRFYHCGEYGEQYGRPHYHALLFNFDFSDKVLWRQSNGYNLYRSEILEQLWPFGHATVGAATFESAAYVARYMLKKQKGKDSHEYYRRVDPDTGNYVDLTPEYATMSRKPGIGKDWLKKYKTDVYPADYVVVKGKKMRPPKYYDCQFAVEHPLEFDEIKYSRLQKALKHADDNTPERLLVKQKIKQAKLNLLRREVDETN